MTHRHDWPQDGLKLRYFRPEEFDHPAEMDPDFLKRLDRLRNDAGMGIVITSDFRTPEENEAIGGFHNSPHLRGVAVDCQPLGRTMHNKMQLVRTALNLWAEGELSGLGLGIYDQHVHIDQCPELERPRLWVGSSK